jgi:two-component system, response regulator / RNA-binding antiterminator
VPGPADLTAWRHDERFRTTEAPLLVLDRELVIRAVNPAHERVMGFHESALVGRDVFDAYPANSAEADGDDGQRSMAASFERVLREARAHDLVVQRYDIPDGTQPGRFVARTWRPVNTPVRTGDAVAGILVRAEELHVPAEAEAVLRRFRDVLRSAGTDDDVVPHVVEAVVWGLHAYGDAVREARQLREALTSRATIDQAKGILMAQRGIDAEEAFRVLARLSNESNVRLAEVARALVYQVQGTGH